MTNDLGRKKLAQMREELTDLEIETEQGDIEKMHKSLVCCHSSFVRVVVQWNKTNTINMTDFDPSIMNMLVDFMYRGSNALFHLSTTQYQQLFVAADYYDVCAVRDKCARHFIRHLNVANCVHVHTLTTNRHPYIATLSLHYICSHLESILLLDLVQMGEPAMVALGQQGFEINMFMKKLKDVVNREKCNSYKARKPTQGHLAVIVRYWNERRLLVTMDVDTLRNILTSDRLHVHMEQSLVVLIVWWTIWDRDIRIPLAASLLPAVQLHRFTDSQIRDMLDWAHVLGNEFVSRTTAILQSRCDTSTALENTVSKRIVHRGILSVGGWSGRTPTQIIELYNPVEDQWTQVKSENPVGRRAYHGLSRIGTQIHLVGGFDGGVCHQANHVLDTETLQWKYCSTMHLKRCYVSVARLPHKRIMAIGGYREPNKRTHTTEVFDPVRNQWTFAKAMNYIRSDSHAARINSNVYMVGGFDGDACLSSVEMYSASSDAWYLVPAMNTQRSGVGAIATDGALYAVGGYNGNDRLNSAERMDPREGKWRNIGSMHDRRSNFGIEVIDGCVIVAGGYTGSLGTTSKCEKYEPRMDEWLQVGRMSVDKSALHLTIVEQWIHPLTHNENQSMSFYSLNRFT